MDRVVFVLFRWRTRNTLIVQGGRDGRSHARAKAKQLPQLRRGCCWSKNRTVNRAGMQAGADLRNDRRILRNVGSCIPLLGSMTVCGYARPKVRMLQKTKFASPINADSTVQSSAKKYFTPPVGQIISTSPRHPASILRGVSRSSRTLGAGCGGRGGAERRTAPCPAKPFGEDGCRGRRSRVVLISRR